VLPLMTAHGCYHGQCGFCNVGYGAGKGFYPLPVEQVIEQIETLRIKYGTRHIFFTDEAIPPRTLRILSAELAGRGAPVNWCGCARFERALSQELLESMSRGGCRMLLFGLETASERMIEHIVKGTQRETMSRILKESTQAGIWSHTFFFFGFPTETMDDAQETVNFVYAHQALIHSASVGEFVLERYSPVHLAPEKFGVRRIIHTPDQDLAIHFDYEVESGLDANMAATVVERLLDVLPTKRFGQYYVHDVYRFLYVSHLHRQGQPLPPWLAERDEETIEETQDAIP
jgi:anaerobic magnesium-protoporphyrin IX monomethyl ester cyclase